MKFRKIVRTEPTICFCDKETRNKVLSKLIGDKVAEAILEHGYRLSFEIKEEKRDVTEGYEMLQTSFSFANGLFSIRGEFFTIEEVGEVLNEKWFDYCIEFNAEEEQ